MKQGRTDRDWAVVSVMAFVAGAVLAWALMSKHPPQRLASLNIDWPAWVQAVGSIAAILVAVYVPWNQRREVLRDEAKRDKARLEVMATALIPALDDIRAGLVALLGAVDKDFKKRRGTSTSLLPRHPEFDQFRPDLHLLGDIAKEVSNAISRQQYFLPAVSAIGGDPDLPQAFKDKVRRDATLAIKEIGIARDKLRAIIG